MKRNFTKTFLSSLTNEEKFNIANDYINNGMQLIELHKVYEDRCSISNFQQALNRHIMKDITITSRVFGVRSNQKVLGSKNESYYMNEDEMAFDPDRVPLSASEKEILKELLS